MILKLKAVKSIEANFKVHNFYYTLYKWFRSLHPVEMILKLNSMEDDFEDNNSLRTEAEFIFCYIL